MGKKGGKAEERKVKSSDFSNYQSIDARPTGLHQIFASFSNIDLSQSGVNASESSARNKSSEDLYLSAVESQSEILTLLNKLNKKDGVTKSKALEALNSSIGTLSDVVLEELIVDIIHVVRRLIIVEPVRKIRSELGVLLFKIALKLKKKTQRYLESFITHWWIAMHDTSNDVADVYVSAFEKLFTSTCSKEEFEQKTFRILMFYIDRLSSDYNAFIEKSISSYTDDWVDIFGKSCQNSATIADMHNRFFYALMHSLMKFFIYYRLYSSQSDLSPNAGIEGLVNKRLIESCRDICKSGSFKQRLSCLKMLVELVKMLDQTKFDYVKSILKVALECAKMDNETHIVYHNVRLICACTRYNSACLDSDVLSSYDSLLISILDRYQGNVNNKIDFFFLFPSLVIYLPKEWKTGVGRRALASLLEHIVHLMKEEIADAKKNFYTFDAKLFRQLGSCMLCCYYKILLQFGSIDASIAEYICLPFQVLFPYQHLCKIFMSQLPKFFNEFIEESSLMSDQNVYTMVVNKLIEFSRDATNVVLMVDVFNLLQVTHEKFNVEPMFHKEHMELIHVLAYEELPRLLGEYLDDDASVEEIQDALNVVADVNELRVDSKLFEVPAILFENSHDTPFEAKFDTVKGVFTKLLCSVDVKRLLNIYEAGSRNFLFMSLVAMGVSEKDSLDIIGGIFSRDFNIDEPFVSFLLVKIIKHASPSLYNDIIGWSVKPSHVDENIIASVLSVVNASLVDAKRRAILAALSTMLSLCSDWTCNVGMAYIVEDIVTLYIYAVLKERVLSLKRLVNFVLDNVLNIWVLEERPVADEEACAKCSTDSEILDEGKTVELGIKLAKLQGPVVFTNTLLKVIGYLSRDKLSRENLYGKSFNLFMSAWLDQTHNVSQDDLNTFYKPFIRSIMSLGVDYATDGCKALSTLFSIHQLETKTVQQSFMVELINELMSVKEYRNLKVLQENVQIFKCFYESLEHREGAFDIIRTFYGENPFAAHFLAITDSFPSYSLDDLHFSSDNLDSSLNDPDSLTRVVEIRKLVHSLDSETVTTCTNNIVHLSVLLGKCSECDTLEVYGDVVGSILRYLAGLDSGDTWLYHAVSLFFSRTLECVVSYKDYLPAIYNVFILKAIVHLYNVSTEQSIVVLYNILALCFKYGVFHFDDSERTEYEFTSEALKEYIDVLHGLSLENCTIYLNGGDGYNYCESHYIFTMVVTLVKNTPESCTEEAKECVYLFLEFLNGGHVPACYLFVLVSELWSCKILYPQLAEFSSIFTKFLRKKEHVISLPKASLFPFLVDTRFDFSQLLYNLCQYSVDDVVTQEDEMDEGEMDEGEMANMEEHRTECDPQLYSNGTRLLVFYLNILIGPYMTENVLNTHKLVQNTQSCDLEKCLISWLTLLNVISRYKELNNLNYANGIIKLLTMKPQDLGQYVEESLQSGIDIAVADSGLSTEYWWLGEFDISDSFEEPLLHMFLNLLILCLQQLLIKDKQCYEIVKMLYFKTAKMFPGEVGEMWNNCKNSYVKKQIKKFTKSEITQKIIEEEIQMIKMNGLDNLQIMYDAGNRIINAKLTTKAEVPTKVSVKIPSTFPLVPLSFTTEDDNNTFKQKYLKWIMLAQSEANKSGISQGLYLWCNNIAKFFDGISECPICYSIVHTQFNTIPNKSCKVCKYKFHTECIYKWFRTAQKAKCPLCQSQVSFASHS